jgi:hypothetical protein
MAGERVVEIAGHKVRAGSVAETILQNALTTRAYSLGVPCVTMSERMIADNTFAADVARALTAPGYVSAAGEVSGG